MTRLIMVRHGQTEANVTGALSSLPPGGPLTPLGRQQADELMRRFADEQIDAVYASTATRAQQTAAPLAAAHELPVQVLDDVQEVFVGDFEGLVDEASRVVFGTTYAAWWTGDLDARMPGGESANEVRERFLPAVAKVLVPGATVVLVSHGASIRIAAAALLGAAATTAYLPNTGVVILARDGETWSLEHWDAAPPAPGDVTAGGPPRQDG